MLFGPQELQRAEPATGKSRLPTFQTKSCSWRENVIGVRSLLFSMRRSVLRPAKATLAPMQPNTSTSNGSVIFNPLMSQKPLTALALVLSMRILPPSVQRSRNLATPAGTVPLPLLVAAQLAVGVGRGGIAGEVPLEFLYARLGWCRVVGGLRGLSPGGLKYDWQADAWTGPAKAATWNGKAVAVVDGTVTVTGAGKLVVDGKATLTVVGGKAGRVVVVRWR